MISCCYSSRWGPPPSPNTTNYRHLAHPPWCRFSLPEIPVNLCKPHWSRTSSILIGIVQFRIIFATVCWWSKTSHHSQWSIGQLVNHSADWYKHQALHYLIFQYYYVVKQGKTNFYKKWDLRKKTKPKGENSPRNVWLRCITTSLHTMLPCKDLTVYSKWLKSEVMFCQNECMQFQGVAGLIVLVYFDFNEVASSLTHLWRIFFKWIWAWEKV